jgi:hypothetical protein
MASGYDVEQYGVSFNNSPLGIRFVQTIHAPEDSVVIHPLQFAKLISHPSFTAYEDLLKD